MSTPTLTHRAPKRVIAGDSIEFLVAVPSDYSGWAGSARLTGPADAMGATLVTTEGSDLHVYFAGSGGAANTGTLPSGFYTVTVWASDGAGRRVTLGQFPLTLAPDRSTGSPQQPRCIRTLAAIEAAIDARITGAAIEEYAVDGTTTRKASLEELERLRNKYATEVSALLNADKPIGSVPFTMSPVSGIHGLRHRLSGQW